MNVVHEFVLWFGAWVVVGIFILLVWDARKPMRGRTIDVEEYRRRCEEWKNYLEGDDD